MNEAMAMSSIRRRPQRRSKQRLPPLLPVHANASTRRRRGRGRTVVAAVIFAASCVALAGWVYLKFGLHKVEEARYPSLLRISSSEHANVTQFFPCLDEVNMHPFKEEIEPVLPSHRKKSRRPRYSSLPCAPRNANACFRGVYDGFGGFLEDARRDVQNSRRPTAKHDPLFRERLAVLVESLIVHPEHPISPDLLLDAETPSLLEPSTWRQQNYTDDPKRGQEAANFGQLHADYLESERYVYTAILYDDPPDNLLGGETALVDFYDSSKPSEESSKVDKVEFGLKVVANETAGAQGDRPLEMTSGMIVEPKGGRLVLFSSGGENFHAPLEVRRGVRPTYHFWFKCKVDSEAKPKKHL